jgi:hypothetical protein
MERKLTKVVDETGNNRTEKMCSCGTDVVKDLYSSESIDTCGDSLPSVEKTPINQRVSGLVEQNN